MQSLALPDSTPISKFTPRTRGRGHCLKSLAPTLGVKGRRQIPSLGLEATCLILTLGTEDRTSEYTRRRSAVVPLTSASLQAFFSSALNSFDEDQDVDKALRYLGLADIQQRFRALAVPLMPHVSCDCSPPPHP